jgi:SPX domain protein involved in polyphosphate accumulation
MDQFRAINYTAVTKIMKKASKLLGARFSKSAAIVALRLQSAVWHKNFCAVLPVVSEVYSVLRGQTSSGKWIPPQSFERCVSHPHHTNHYSVCDYGYAVSGLELQVS